MTSERTEKILKSVSQKVHKLLKPDRFYVALHDSERSALTFPWVVEHGKLRQWDRLACKGAEGKGNQKDEHIRLPNFVITQASPQLFEENLAEQFLEASVTYWPNDGELLESWLGVPMTSGDDVSGALVVESHTSKAFGERGVRILSTIARQTAVALENARLYERLHRKIDDLSAVNEIGQELTSRIRLETQEILDLVHDQASKLMDTSNMYIALYDEATDTVSFDLMLMDGKRAEVKSRSGGKGRTEWIIDHREPILIKTRAESQRWYGEQGRAEYIGEPFASWIGVPMMSGERVLGVIAAYHKTTEYVYDEDDLQILSSMASQAAIALDNARLYDNLEERARILENKNRQLEERTKQLSVLHKISVQVSSALKTKKVLQSVAQGVCELVEADIATIFPFNADLQEFGKGVRVGEVTEILRRPTASGLAAELVKTGTPVYKSKDDMTDQDNVFIDDRLVMSYAGIPLRFGEESMGVLFVNYYQNHKFSEMQQQLIELFAAQAASAINNARRYELADKLAKAERWAELGQLAGSLAHRIGNKGGTIRLRAKELAEHLDEKLPNDPIAAQALNTILQNNRYLMELSVSLLKPFRASGERLAFSDVTLFINGAINSAEIPSDVKIETIYLENLPLVRANKFFVEVFLEIIMNAVEAMRNASSKKLTIKVGYDDNWVNVSFADTGTGIDERDRSRIFELFTKSSTSTDTQHFGYGLWWVRTFLRDIGGDIRVKSRPDVGTTFTVQIPREKTK